MRFFLSFIIIFYFSPLYAEEVPAGYVAKWDVAPLSEDDYNTIDNKKCRTFSSVLTEAKTEWPHTSAFKIINYTLILFIEGYNKQEKLQADKVVVWPDYSSSEWYVLMGYQNCFVKWIEIQPDNIHSIINEGRKALEGKI